MTDGAPKPLRLSVLDIGPIRVGQTSTQAFAAMIALAQRADQLGYERYWLAEHHNVPSTVASIMSVFASVLASRTRSIRVGGNILLPHYPPFLVAEATAILEACFPGRVDLALGGASGADAITSAMLRGGRDGGDFARGVQELLLMLRPEGAALKLRDDQPDYRLKATPAATDAPATWIWGTARDQAVMAGQLGLPFMYAYHIVGRSDMDAVRAYRDSFRPSPMLAEPHALASAIVIIGKDAERAEAMARPHLRAMVAFRNGLLEQALPLVGHEDDLPTRTDVDEEGEAMFRESWIIGSPDDAAEQVRALARELDVDEIMVNPVAASDGDDPPDRAPNREYTLEALASTILA